MLTRARLLHPAKRLIVKGVILAVWCALWLGQSSSLGLAVSLADWKFVAFAALGACLAAGIAFLETREKLAWIYGVVEYAIIFAALCYGASMLLSDLPWPGWWLLIMVPSLIQEAADSALKASEAGEKAAQMPSFLRSDKWKSRLVALKFINSAIWGTFFLLAFLFALLALFGALPF